LEKKVGRQNAKGTIVTRKNHHQIREAKGIFNQNLNSGEAVQQLEISQQTYYRWRKEYGELDQTQARKLKLYLMLIK